MVIIISWFLRQLCDSWRPNLLVGVLPEVLSAAEELQTQLYQPQVRAHLPNLFAISSPSTQNSPGSGGSFFIDTPASGLSEFLH